MRHLVVLLALIACGCQRSPEGAYCPILYPDQPQAAVPQKPPSLPPDGRAADNSAGRKMVKNEVVVRLRLVTGSFTALQETGWLRRDGLPVLVEEASIVERILADPRMQCVQAPVITAFENQTAHASFVQQYAYLADYRLRTISTGGSTGQPARPRWMLDPEISVLNVGDIIQIRASVDQSAVVLDDLAMVHCHLMDSNVLTGRVAEGITLITPEGKPIDAATSFLLELPRVLYGSARLAPGAFRLTRGQTLVFPLRYTYQTAAPSALLLLHGDLRDTHHPSAGGCQYLVLIQTDHRPLTTPTEVDLTDSPMPVVPITIPVLAPASAPEKDAEPAPKATG